MRITYTEYYRLKKVIVAMLDTISIANWMIKTKSNKHIAGILFGSYHKFRCPVKSRTRCHGCMLEKECPFRFDSKTKMKQLSSNILHNEIKRLVKVMSVMSLADSYPQRGKFIKS